MNADARRFIARSYIAHDRLFFVCSVVQESRVFTAKRAESAKRWLRGCEGRWGAEERGHEGLRHF